MTMAGVTFWQRVG